MSYTSSQGLTYTHHLMIETDIPHQTDHLVLSFNGKAVDVISPIVLNHQRIQDLSSTVTAMRVEEVDGIQDRPSVVYTPSEDYSASYDPEERKLFVTGPAKSFERGDSLVYVAEYLAVCMQAAEEGTFLVHAAATHDTVVDKSCLLLGEKGAGKTTAAIRLCAEEGHSLIGNDQVYVGSDAGEMFTYQGNPWFNVRRTAIETDSYLQSLLGQSRDTEDVSSWNNKIRVDPADIESGIELGKKALGGIFHIRIDPQQTGVYSRRWEGTQANLILHERLGRHISAQATPFQDDNGNYLGSLPLIEPNRTMPRRDRLVVDIAQTGIHEVFAHDSGVLVDFVIDKLRQKS